ncbi:MAG: MFS transporter [Chloroflexi bacterium]|nr:MFS transporter [Chloroflexota bacterium]
MIQTSVLGKTRTLFYGWVIVAAGMVLQMLGTGLGGQGLGAFLVPLEKEFGWTKTALAGGRSLMQLESGLLGPIEGFLVDWLGPRTIMVIGSVIFGAGLVAMGFINSLWSYYLAYVIIAVGASLSGSIALFVALNNWFQRKRTLAMALTQTGNGFAGIFIIPLLLIGLSAFGWRATAIASGVLIWVTCIPIAFVVRRAPEPYGTFPDGVPPSSYRSSDAKHNGKESDSSPAVDFTLKEAMRTRSFWFISLGHGMAVMIISAVTVHQFAHAEQGVGLSSSAVGVMVAVLGVATVVGRILGGILGDRNDMRYLAVGCMIGTSIALVIFALATSLWQVILFAILYGLFWGMRGPMMSSLRGLYFGRSSFGAISGVAAIITTACSMTGPLIAGYFADTRGDYVQGFLILAVVSGLGSIFFIMTKRPAPPARPTSTVPTS